MDRRETAGPHSLVPFDVRIAVIWHLSPFYGYEPRSRAIHAAERLGTHVCSDRLCIVPCGGDWNLYGSSLSLDRQSVFKQSRLSKHSHDPHGEWKRSGRPRFGSKPGSSPPLGCHPEPGRRFLANGGERSAFSLSRHSSLATVPLNRWPSANLRREPVAFLKKIRKRRVRPRVSKRKRGAFSKRAPRRN